MNIKQIIAPSYARTHIMREVVLEENNPFDKQVLSLSSFKNSLLLEPKDNIEEEAYLYNNIKKKINKDNIYYNQLLFPTFFNYFYEFAKLLIRYGIKVEDLPEDDQQDKSKKEILSYFLCEDLIEKETQNALNQKEDLSNVEILDYFYSDYADKKDIDRLVNNKANYVLNKKENNTSYSCRYANNAVKEVIGIAQDFVKNKTDLSKCVIMLNDKDSYIPIIRRVFEYYKIPYNIRYQKTNNEAQRFLALLNYVRKQDLNSFIRAYNYRCFFKSNYRLVEYIKTVNLEYDQLFNPLDKIAKLLKEEDQKEYIKNTFGYKKINELAADEKLRETIMCEIRPKLEKIKEYKNKPLHEQCTYVYNSLFSRINTDKLNKTTIDEIQDVHNLCMSMIDKDNDNYELLSYELSNLKTNVNTEYDKGIKIIDAYEDIKGIDKAIILGCVQQNYPKSVAMSGFFDEEYISRVKDFPSLIERNDYFETQYSRMLKNFKEVIFSYPMASVDGDQYQRSILISNFVESTIDERGNKNTTESPWDYTEIDKYTKKEEKISEDVAKNLYLEDGKLSASPSGFEQYVKCPFAYFVQRGLKIEDKSELKIEANTIGSIQHNLLERSFKKEIELNEDNVEELLSPYFDLIGEIIQNKKDEIDATKKRLAEGLKKSIGFLNDFRSEDDYSYYPEENINNFIWKLDNNELKFTGKIDRLDKKDKNYRIIDYKSSEKSVNLWDVKKGINFQLLSYLVLYYLQLNDPTMVPELFAYLSLKNSKIKKEDVDIKDEKKEEELRREDVKYSTYVTSDIVLDEKYYSIKDIAYKSGKQKPVEDRKYDFEEIRKIIEKLFTTISNKILSGDISIEPKEGACNFCKYSDICHFNGEELSKEEMTDLTI